MLRTAARTSFILSVDARKVIQGQKWKWCKGLGQFHLLRHVLLYLPLPFLIARVMCCWLSMVTCIGITAVKWTMERSPSLRVAINTAT